MKKLLGLALLLSVATNAYLGFLLYVQDNRIDAGLHAEIIATMGLRDLSYLLRKSGATRTQLLEWASSKPNQPGTERLAPELVDGRLVWFPLEVAFGATDTIERISVGGEAY